MTTAREAAEAVAGRWLELWVTASGEPLTPTVFENDASVAPSIPADQPIPPDEAIGLSWCRLTFRTLLSTQETMGSAGSRMFERRAQAIVQIFTPVNVGTGVSLDLAQIARDVFEGVTLDALDLSFGDVTPREVGVDGRWYQTNVTAAFTYYEQK